MRAVTVPRSLISGCTVPRDSALGSEASRLRAVRAYEVLDSPPDAEFNDLAAVAAQLLGTADAAVSVVDDDRAWFKAAVRGQGGSTPRSLSFCALVVEAGQPLIVEDARLDRRFDDHPFVTTPGGLRFFAGVPLVTADGHAVGALSVWDGAPRRLSEEDLAGLRRLGGQALALLELRRRTRELERDRAVLALTGRVLGLITAGADLPEVLEAIVRGVEQTTPGSLCSILLLEGDQLRDAAGPSLPAQYRAAVDGLRIGDGVGACGTAAATGRPVVSADIATDPRWEGLRQLAAPHGLRSCWSIPIFGPHGPVLGTFALYHREAAEPTAEEEQLLDRWSALAALAIERTCAHAEMRRVAAHDPLTGLPNRALLLTQVVEQLTRRGQDDVAVLSVNLDRFTLLNDSRGQHAGDAYLRAAADRLRTSVRVPDVIARVNGDEFVVLCPDVRGPDEADRVAQRIVTALARPLDLAGRPVTLSASVGVAVTGSGAVAADAESLLRAADTAMRAAKRSGGNRFARYLPTFGHALDRLELEAELRAALLARQLRCAYQSKVDLHTGVTVGVEALARWTSPTRGPVPPADFIPVAEDSDLIAELGGFVLETACTQLAAWRRQDPQLHDLVVWVNVSPRQLSSPDLVTAVARALRSAGLPGDRLGLEVTETAIAADLPLARAVLDDLRALGVRIAVDDFGTGFSSLSQLKRLPVDVLKIDRTFVDGLGVDPDDTAIVEAVIALAHSLRLAVVAEGVETGRQRDALRALGCDVAQGWYYGRNQEGDMPPPRSHPV